MKFAFLLLVIMPTSLLAQSDKENKENNKRPVRIALRAGLYFSRPEFSNMSTGVQKPTGDDAFYAGVQVDIPLSRRLSIAPEVLYAMSSYQTSLPPLYVDDLSHLLVPLLFRYKLGKVSLLAGPQAEVLLNATGRYLERAPDSDPDYSFYDKIGDINGVGYSNFSMSGVVGIEWIFKHRFGLDARYQFGLTNTKGKPTKDIIPVMSGLSDNIKVNAFQVGLIFRFGKRPK